MSTFQPVTETIILHLKESVNLEDVASSAGARRSPAVEAFVHLTDTVKSQQGFLRQFWGHQVEDHNIFVWSIDWKSSEYSTAFVNSEEHKSLMADMGLVFDLDKAAPLTMYTRFTSDATAALVAAVTEVAFFTVPNSAREEAKILIENDVLDSKHPVLTVGKSSGGAIGWVFDAENANDAAPDAESIALHGVFGYASVDDHIKWRKTPEHAQVIEDMGRSPYGNLGLGNAIMPGGNIFVTDSSMFHVKFQTGSQEIIV